MKIAVPDVISNSYFPALAAVELGYFADEGLDVSLEMIFPVDNAYRALRDGAVDFVGGSAHAALAAFRMGGRAVLCAPGAGHVLVSRHACELVAERGNVGRGQGLQDRRRSLGRDGAASAVDRRGNRPCAAMGVTLAPVPGLLAAGINFGVSAARALEDARRSTDSGPTAWAPKWRSAAASGPLCIDIRRGDGSKACFDYSAASIAATSRFIDRSPEIAAAAVRAIVKTQQSLKENVALAADVGRKLFPPEEADLIVELIRRDLPYYDASISQHAVAGMNRFARDLGLLIDDVPYEKIVATQFKDLWRE